jgi:hypothetical protein
LNDTVVFLGPSLDLDAARTELAADYRPPAAQGDVLSAWRSGARRIGIIDGRFNDVPSVWHKEILLALEEGALVFGAASMGALRAAELHRFGMIGVGQVFEWYRDGVLGDDDEVAVIHGREEHGFSAQSEALVNIRAAVGSASEAGVISAELGARLLALAKSEFYPRRSYTNLARAAKQHGLDGAALDAFFSFARAQEPLKRRDARALLRRLSQREPLPRDERTRVERTYFLQRLESRVALEHALAAVKPVPGSDAARDSEARASSPGALNDLRKRTLLRVLALKHASDLGMVATPEETQIMADDFRRARHLTSPEAMHAWLAAADLSLERFSEIVRELATVRKLEQHYAVEVERRLADHLKLGLGPER